MDKKTGAHRISRLIGAGGTMIVAGVIIAILYPAWLERWPIFLTNELVGIVLIITGIMLSKKYKIPLNKKASEL